MSRTTPVALACALLLLLALPAASPGAVTIGVDLSATPDWFNCTCSGIQVSDTSTVAVVPDDGVITRWRTRAPNPTSLHLDVVRRTGTSTYRRIGSSPPLAVVNAVSRQEVRIPVRTGDFIGLGGAAGLPNYDGGSTSLTRLFTPGIGDAEATPSVSSQDLLALAADLEPDADGDGFGDETQDECPDVAARQAAPCSGRVVGPSVRYDRSDGGAIVSGGIQTNATLTGPGAPVVAADGVLVRYRLTAFSGTFGVQVLRGATPDVVGEAPLASPVAPQRDGVYSRILNVPVRIPVRAGDVLGFRTTGPGSFAIRNDGASLLSTWAPALTPGAAPAGPPILGPVLARINGDVEPDADRDGFGDETQDGCPTDASTSGACAPPPAPTPRDVAAQTPPAPAPAVVTVTQPAARVVVRPGTARLAVKRLRYRGTRALAVPLTCPASSESCRGRLELKVGGRRSAGTASFALRAGQRRSVSVRLNARARRMLRRGGKVSARIVPAGPKTTTGALTLTR